MEYFISGIMVNRSFIILQLSNPLYQDAYDPGTSVGSIVPSGWQTGTDITIHTQNWSQTDQNLR